jgi:S-adenosylmethionine:tRNA ribosyltransferase-isomerase
MLLSEFDFPFDPALVAGRPVEPRDQARLLVLSRQSGAYTHHRVADLPALLEPGDLLVVNDTKVLPVRVTGRKRPSGGKVELVFVKDMGDNTWEVLMKGGGKVGQVIELDREAHCTVMETGPSRILVGVTASKPIRALFQTIGHMPLPPYIKRAPEQADRQWYQTYFAREEGSIAAPTAGLHFTERVVTELRACGIHIANVTLHVGPATFRPVKTTSIEDHQMLPECIEVSSETAQTIMRTKTKGGRIVAVGTTVVRTLETACDEKGIIAPYDGEATLYITPGYRFRMVDAMLTNFHLPRTTLLMLVSAFAGVDRLRAAYAEAIGERYRFYSYGDAMLIV